MIEKEILNNKDLKSTLDSLKQFLNDKIAHDINIEDEKVLDLGNSAVQEIFCDSFLNRENKEDYPDSYFFEILSDYIFDLLKKDFPNATLLSEHRYLCDDNSGPKEIFDLLSTKEKFLKVRKLIAKCKFAQEQFDNLISLICSKFDRINSNEEKYDTSKYPTSIEIEFFCTSENYEWPRSRDSKKDICSDNFRIEIEKSEEQNQKPSLIEKIKFSCFVAKFNLNTLLNKNHVFKDHYDDYDSGDGRFFADTKIYNKYRKYIRISKNIPYSKSFEKNLIKYRYFLSYDEKSSLRRDALYKCGLFIKNEILSRFNRINDVDLESFFSKMSKKLNYDLENKNYKSFYISIKELLDLG